MRRKVSVVTDSTAEIPLERAQELGLTVVPLNIRFASEVFQDQVDLSTEEFFQRLETSRTPPKTSEPSPGLFYSIYERLAAQSRDILSIHISSDLSKTHESAVQARDALLGRCNVLVVGVDALLSIVGVHRPAVMATLSLKRAPLDPAR